MAMSIGATFRSRFIDTCAEFQAFKAADRRKTGTITFKALRDILETIAKGPLTNEKFYCITADADVESTGLLDFQEYCKCCLEFVKMRKHSGKRVTKEVAETLAHSGAHPGKLDAALEDFDMHFSISKKMAKCKVALPEGKECLTTDQLMAVLRKTRDDE